MKTMIRGGHDEYGVRQIARGASAAPASKLHQGRPEDSDASSTLIGSRDARGGNTKK